MKTSQHDKRASDVDTSFGAHEHHTARNSHSRAVSELLAPELSRHLSSHLETERGLRVLAPLLPPPHTKPINVLYYTCEAVERMSAREETVDDDAASFAKEDSE